MDERPAQKSFISKGSIIKTRGVADGFWPAAAWALMLILGLAFPAQGQEEWLIAMGDLSSYRGTNVPSPDPNGHYWNAVDSGHYFPSLTNTTGQATSLALAFDYSNGNDSYNGPAGLTFNPNDVVINAAALGDLGYDWGVYHYYTSSGFEIQGLNPSTQYNLTFFGSHAYSTDTTTTYSLYTDNGYTTSVTSVSLNIQVPSNTGQWNTNQVAIFNNVSPQADGVMYIGFYGSNGSGIHDGTNLGYLNAMEIQAVTNVIVISSNSASSFTGGATVPWITYEAENMTNTGTILGPSYAGNNVASESSGRQCAQLSTNGAYVQFTAQSNANAIVVRYSVPDTANGVGTNYTLSLYTNGLLAAELPMTSMYSWLYGAYPFSNTPGDGSPRNFYDEVRTNGWTINAGDVIKLQKNSTDTAANYVIDLVDLENVPPPITNQPNGSVSVKIYGAVGDGVSDDTAAIQGCISGNGSTWLPPGNYKVTGLINIPANKTIRGAGMWYTTLVGDPTLYTNSSRRVTLNGDGSNIHLSDIAIVGKLNYRNDSEPNDGIGGSYGSGSTISNMWVEHTKTGAWIVNSLGLVVNSCRFRDTIADGCNIDVGMESTTVTNCTTRGTGDDCFAIWPATYTSQTYSPGLNVFTHCTGQVPFLANGGAIYGGANNQITDCLFQDIPYDCGILISTTFNVGGNVFSGTTVAQGSELNRCGGLNMGAGLQICLGTYNGGVTGLNLNNLNITNSACDGLSIIGGSDTGGQGTLSSAIMSYVNIPNYGLGGGSRNGLWARSDAVGSMTVSNSTIVEYLNNSASFTFNFVTSSVPVTVQTSPSGQTFTVDGTNYSSAQTFNWIYGSSHTIVTSSPQSGGTGVQYVWGSWNDGGALSHAIMANTNFTYIANFTTQYFLTVNAGAGGNVSPASGWNNSGTNVTISATASNNYSFGGWSGSGSGSYSGGSNPGSVTMNGPITETANFTPNIPVTVQASLAGLSFTVDGTAYTNTQSFSWVPGSNHTIATTSPQSGSAGVQYLWSSWSDSGAISHIVAPASSTIYTANFTTQYFLTMNAGAGGSVSPASGWNSSSAVVGISATASNGYTFGGWAGSGSGSYSGSNNSTSVTMNGPITETASFAQTNAQALAILAITVNPNSTVTLIYATTPGFAYHVESTTNLTPASWTVLPGSATNATSSSVTFTDTSAPGNPQLFYRVGSP
jgi:hypothetical protein